MNVRSRAVRRSSPASHTSRRLWAAAAVGLMPVATAVAGTYTVTSSADDGSAGTLRYAITQANANPGSTINFAANLGTIALTSSLPNINASMAINGAAGDGGISGSGQYRIFFVNSGTVGISNLVLQGGVAQGGNGGSGTGGGGGGMGAGGAIFIRGNDGGRPAPTVTLTNLNLVNNKAVGGTGGGVLSGSVGGGGGGGLAGNGGNSINYAGGGGGAFPGQNGDAGITQPGNGSGPGGDNVQPGQTGGDFQGGGGSLASGQGTGGGGGYGGGGGGGGQTYVGYVPGPPGATRVTPLFGPPGGFGGGGGGNGGSYGGFGGGAGSFDPNGPSEYAGIQSVFGGGASVTAYGGGGAGLGGALFISAGANVTIVGGTITNNSTAGGLDGDGGNANSIYGTNILSNGAALGDALFLQGANVTYSVPAGQVQTLTQSIYGALPDDSDNNGTLAGYLVAVDKTTAAAITKSGPGQLAIATTVRYGGTTVVNQGVLEVTTGGTLGSGSATVNAGAELRVDGSGVINDYATTDDSATYTSTNTITVSGTSTTPGLLTVTGSGSITNEPIIAVGNTGLGVFNLSGGTVALTAGMTLGQAAGSVGTFNLSGGVITGNQLLVGYNSGTGVVNHTGGQAGFNALELGQLSDGTYNLSGANSYLQAGNASASYNASIGTSEGVTGTLNVAGGEFRTLSNLFVGLQGNGIVDQSAGRVIVLGFAELANGYSSTGQYSLSGTSLMEAHSLLIANTGTAATFNQTGGALVVSNTFTYDNATSTGGNGILYVGVAGPATFSLAGGTVTADVLHVADNPEVPDVFAQSGGTLTTTAEFIGVAGVGLFNQSGGTHTVNGTMTVGQYNVATGTYNLTGGTLTAQAAAIGPTTNLLSNPVGYVPSGYYRGMFAQAGGSFAVSGNLDLATLAGSTAVYTLSGPTTAANVSAGSLRVGVGGTGLFAQTGGTATVTGDLTLGVSTNSAGTYNLSGGALSAGSVSMAVGDGNTALVGPGAISVATVTQTGGTANVSGGLAMAVGYASRATYTLGGGTLVAGSVSMAVGNEGEFGNDVNPAVATFTQTGGTATVTGTLALGVGYQSQASYNMTGGSLTTGQTTLGLTPNDPPGTFSFSGGAGTFNQTGGSHTVGTLTIGPNGTYAAVGSGTGFPPTLRAGTIVGQNGGGTFLVDGAILRPSTDNATWISGQNVSIGAGGMSVLTDGYNVTITSGLMHNAALGLTNDGGLGVGNGTGAAGTGSLTLTGTDTYTGNTRVTAGATLYYNAFSFTGAGSSITVNGGVLGGTGDTDSQGLVGTTFGSGTGVIAPGATAGSVGNFTFNGATVQIGPYGTYAADINSAASSASLRSDMITATGVNLSSGATIVLDDLAPTTALPAGTVLTLIDNDSIGPIIGAFANLADGSTVTVGENTYVADYEGGDGNDLTLTVAAPEPTSLLLGGLLLAPALGRRRRRRPSLVPGRNARTIAVMVG